jgi:hypothetical protein
MLFFKTKAKSMHPTAHWNDHFDIPAVLNSDRGAQFTSNHQNRAVLSRHRHHEWFRDLRWMAGGHVLIIYVVICITSWPKIYEGSWREGHSFSGPTMVRHTMHILNRVSYRSDPLRNMVFVILWWHNAFTILLWSLHILWSTTTGFPFRKQLRILNGESA